MNQEILPHNSRVYQEDGLWKLRLRDGPPSGKRQEGGSAIEPVWLGPAVGAGRLTRNEAHRLAWVASRYLVSRLPQDVIVKQSNMTVAEFVEHKFAPEHIAAKRLAGRAHYRAILKHVLKPEEVDRVFHGERVHPRSKLKTIPDWPYLSNLRLCDARTDHIQELVSAALARGYAPQTVTHIRNVVNAIFAHAKREQCFMGENPAGPVKLSEITRRQARPLTFAETKDVLGKMEYPEREMMLITVFTGMNMVEICGLQWKYVNLETVERTVDGEAIPPRTIAVRKKWCRGELELVKECRERYIRIPEPLLQPLRTLRRRPSFTGPEDFVFVSRAGTPVNQTNILERRLKPISKLAQVPALSWHLFLRTREALASELGKVFQYYMGVMVRQGTDREQCREHTWHCRTQSRHSSL